jgi:hypothetical protein
VFEEVLNGENDFGENNNQEISLVGHSYQELVFQRKTRRVVLNM